MLKIITFIFSFKFKNKIDMITVQEEKLPIKKMNLSRGMLKILVWTVK